MLLPLLQKVDNDCTFCIRLRNLCGNYFGYCNKYYSLQCSLQPPAKPYVTRQVIKFINEKQTLAKGRCGRGLRCDVPYGPSTVYFNHVWTACGSTKTQVVQRFTFSSLIPTFAHKFLALFSYFWINHSQQVLIVLSLSSVCVVIEVLGHNVGRC